jgi:HEAT repeat protein
MMLRLPLCLALCCVAFAPAPTGAACELDPERAIAGSPLSFWTAELATRDRERVKAARQALREHPVDALAAILASKTASGDLQSARRWHSDLNELFEEGAGAATPFLVSYLECDRALMREMAIQLLGWIGPEASAAAPGVIAALADQDAGVRMQAGFTVARIGVVDDKVLAALRNALDDEKWRAANAAAMALAGFWPRSRPTFLEALRGKAALARNYAMRGLKRVPDIDSEVIAVLVERALRDVSWNRQLALECLRELDPALVVPHLDQLRSLLDDDLVRCEIARLLIGRVGPELEPVLVTMLVELMQGPQTPRRDACHEKVHEDMVRLGGLAVEPLATLLRHPEPHVRANALMAISSIEPRPPAVYGHFLAVIDDDELRNQVGHRLADSGADALPVLRVMLQHDDPEVRQTAALAALRLGDVARPLAPLLVERLPTETGSTRQSFMAALGYIGGDAATAAVPLLRRALADPMTHAEALSALARISGPEAADLAPDLIVLLAEQSQGMCPHPTADEELLAIGPAAIPAVIEALADDGYGPRWRLLQLLDEWGDEALAAAVPVFERWVETRAAFALDGAERLMRLGRLDAARGLPVFNDALASYNDWRRLRGAEGLVRLGGPQCARGREALIEMLEHRHESYRERALAALDHACP